MDTVPEMCQSPAMAPPDEHASFPTTHWTLVEIVKSPDTKQAAYALEQICEHYWYPIYAFLRRSGKTAHDAEDLTQMLFQRLVAGDALAQVQRERGRLRSFLIAMVRQLISRQARHEQAEKRGGVEIKLSLDEVDADDRYLHEPLDLRDPELLFHRAWARQLVETVRKAMHDSFTRTGRAETYQWLEPYLGYEEKPAPFTKLGVRLGCTEQAARVMVHRLRGKFRELLEVEIARTVAQPEDVAAEMAWLREVLR